MPETEEFDAAMAIEALLSAPEKADPEPDEAETPEPKPIETEPEPAQETEPDEITEPSAEVEGATLETKPAEPEPKAVAPKADALEPKTAEKPAPDPNEELLSQLNALVPQLQVAFYNEFADVKSDADLFKIGQEDPARYNRFIMQQSQLGRALNRQQELASDKQQRFLRSQVGVLQTSFPEYVDPVKGAALRAEFTAFAQKRGFTEDRMRSASAADILTLRDAMNWEKHQAAQKAKPAEISAAQAKAKEKAAKAPLVQKPGAPETNGKTDKAKQAFEQFSKTRRPEDLARYLDASGLA